MSSARNLSTNVVSTLLWIAAQNTTKAFDFVTSATSASRSIGSNFETTWPPDITWTRPASQGQLLENTTGVNATLSPEECQEKLEYFRHNNQLVFDRARMARVLVTWAVFVLSAVGNCFVLTSVTVRRRRREMSHSQLIMMHLTIANLAFTVFILPVDAIWQTTTEWYGGEFLCRITNVMKQFSMYSSSAMVVVMGIDRVANLMCPKSLHGQRRRIQTMLVIAWIFCLVNAIPAGVIFSVATVEFCPGYKVMQCVDLAVQSKARLGAYYVYTMLVSFFAPLVCILVCYLLIAIAISKMAKLSKEAQQKRCQRGSSSNSKSVTKRGLDRARRVSLIVTGLITATFILCWGPYYVTGLIEWFGKSDGKQKMSRMARDVMLMSMYLNPMLHPIITIWLMKEIRQNIIMQCRGGRRRRRMPKRNPCPVAKMEKNGIHQLMPKNGNETARDWL